VRVERFFVIRSLAGVVWIVVGLIVAANHHYFHAINHVSPFLSAVLAVIAWPLILLNVHISI
jgi:ABC-type anion transport system duplicated permease subunit